MVDTVYVAQTVGQTMFLLNIRLIVTDYLLKKNGKKTLFLLLMLDFFCFLRKDTFSLKKNYFIFRTNKDIVVIDK